MANDPQREPDLVDKALGAVDGVLDTVHDKVIRPIILAGRYIAYGLIILLAAIVIVVALLIGSIRFMNVYFFAHHIWLTDVVVGAVLFVTGLVVWRFRASPKDRR
jgi:VIT1/CCC1 family predicted Fe2+/Mn2+ transporter